MTKQVEVRLYGANGKSATSVDVRGGFSTRHIQAPRQGVPSLFEPVATEADEIDPNAIAGVLSQMETGWRGLDEIVFVASAKCNLSGVNHTSVRDALRTLYHEGRVEHRKTYTDEFRLKSETNLQALLAEVDARLAGGVNNA